MSSDSPSLDDKGVEDDVSLCVSMGSLAPGWQRVQMMTLVSACYRTLSLKDNKRVFIQITSWVSPPATWLLGSGLTEIVLYGKTLGYLCMSLDSPSLDDKGAKDDISLCVSTGSLAPGWQRVQMTMLVSACYQTLSLTDSKRVFIRITTWVSPPATWLLGSGLTEIVLCG